MMKLLFSNRVRGSVQQSVSAWSRVRNCLPTRSGISRQFSKSVTTTSTEGSLPHYPIITRQRLRDRYCTDPYEPVDLKERVTYPKRKSPFKRAQALIDALQDEEAALMVLSGRSVFPRKIPYLRPGHIVRVSYLIDSSRAKVQHFTGVCIAIKNRGLGSSFVLRNVIDGVAVERRWPLYSPLIKDAEVVGKRDYRRNKLWYLRRKPLRESSFGVATKPPVSS